MKREAVRYGSPGKGNVKPADRKKIALSASGIINLLQLRGYIINSKRIAFVAGVCSLGVIDDAENLWFHLKQQNVPISITSVYNNLRIMVKENLMTKTAQNKCSSYVFCADLQNMIARKAVN